MHSQHHDGSITRHPLAPDAPENGLKKAHGVLPDYVTVDADRRVLGRALKSTALCFNTRRLSICPGKSMKYSELVLYGVYSDLRTEVARRLLGVLWWALEPVMYMAVFYVVFGLGLRQGDTDYVPFLLCGLVAWKWFDSSIRQAGMAIQGNSGLIQQIFVPKYVFALIQVLSNTFKFFIVLLLLLGFLLLFGKEPTLEWLGLVPLLLVQLLLTLSLGLLLSALIPFAQDLKQVVDNLLMLMMFMSGIFYDLQQLPATLQGILNYNPMLQLIQAYRAILLHNQWPDWLSLGWVVLGALPVLLLAVLILRRFERHYPKLML
ncbi:MAG: ABC transporter permease [Pseudomonadaceae bacterium]|nr:ABC transporter permease [Pseudomonadaceae bacterium]